MDQKPFYAMIVPMQDMAQGPVLGGPITVLPSPIPPALPADFENCPVGTTWAITITADGPRWARVQLPAPPPSSTPPPP